MRHRQRFVIGHNAVQQDVMLGLVNEALRSHNLVFKSRGESIQSPLFQLAAAFAGQCGGYSNLSRRC